MLPEPEQFSNAEERRLFYVALTRARQAVYLLADQMRPSAFVRELINDLAEHIQRDGSGSVRSQRCPRCSDEMIRRVTEDRVRFVCRHGELCGGRSPPCTSCGEGVPARDEKDPNVMRWQACGEAFWRCPNCGQGWMVPRTGRIGTFLGCSTFPNCRSTMRMSLGPGFGVTT